MNKLAVLFFSLPVIAAGFLLIKNLLELMVIFFKKAVAGKKGETRK